MGLHDPTFFAEQAGDLGVAVHVPCTLRFEQHDVGGIVDHIHILAGLRPSHRLSDVMREVKHESSRWIHETIGKREFAWQEGYGAFTVSASNLDRVRDYVLGQEAHHRAKTFQEEYVAMLQRGLIDYDERYLW